MQPAGTPDLSSYDRIVVAFSGGKDSLACVLHLLDSGVPKSKIELWHHDVDGREGSELMDWACTAGYCRAVARALDVPLYFSWKVGGFEREMNRDSQLTAPTAWEEPQPDGSVIVRQTGGKLGKPATRQKFPQVSADLTVRWCSAYLKIDVCRRALANDSRFTSSRTLVVTGERAEESTSRAKYKTFEPHPSDLRNGIRKQRHIDAWRPVHGWPEALVWKIIERYGINPHPAYRAGWGRVSCAACIFGSPDQWASLTAIAPQSVATIAAYEERFELTIKRSENVNQQATRGTTYAALRTPAGQAAAAEATDRDWAERVQLEPGEWELPAGAFGESTGPS